MSELFRKPGQNPNPICKKCPGDQQDQPIIWLTILTGLTPDGDDWSGGEILDPDNGKSYRCYLKQSHRTVVPGSHHRRRCAGSFGMSWDESRQSIGKPYINGIGRTHCTIIERIYSFLPENRHAKKQQWERGNFQITVMSQTAPIISTNSKGSCCPTRNISQWTLRLTKP